uniref:rootletin-like isoform X2 n=1 Tax=Doryrhamphus excisus TaxID=161450 RepID=UPI0025ADD4B3|nr:rootletin-like isoform X2 [Doryrhamphus excisus]
MSGDGIGGSCEKFQANLFNHSKCQNCFKSRELHPPSDPLVGQGKPVYGGWLCLAPEGTDFENPTQRPRKWQRRFFLLYEHGSLTFALDELPSTLPQGTVNMSLCTDILDAEPRTGQRNTLCIVTAEQEVFVRAESKEIINGWSEQLGVYVSGGRQNQKKKRKVEPVGSQEPTPAKMAATRAETVNHLQEDQQAETTAMWARAGRDPPVSSRKGRSDARLPEREWRRYWCVLSADSLRFYKDFQAEELSDLEREVDLTECSNVCDCDVQKNYGFRIHTPHGVHTLSAMTAGIRRNWIQALMKNVRTAPDVSSQPDVTRDSSERCRTVLEPRRDGRNKTSDLVEWKSKSRPPTDADLHAGQAPPSLQSGDLEKSRRRELRRRRCESILGVSPGREVMGDATAAGPRSRLEEQMEACWKQVEKTTFRHVRSITLTKQASVTSTLHDDKKGQLEDSESGGQQLRASSQLEPLHGCPVRTGSRSPEHPEEQKATTCSHVADQEVLPVCCDAQCGHEGQPGHSSSMLDTLAEAGGDSLGGATEESARVRKVSQEVALPTRQTLALHRRNQEMLNQLSEADLHIQRLKEALSRRYVQVHPREMEDLERELMEKEQQLLEAQTLITSLEESLRDAQAVLQRHVPAEKSEQEGSVGNVEGYLLRCFEATEAKLSELEKQLHQSEQRRRELQVENATLKETRKVYLHRDAQTEAGDFLPLPKEAEGTMTLRWNLERFLEVVDRLGVSKTKTWMADEQQEEGRLKWEEPLSTALDTSCPGEQEAELLRSAAPQMIPENQVLLSPAEEESSFDGGRRGLEGEPQGSTVDGLWDDDSDASSDASKQPCHQRLVELSGMMGHMTTCSSLQDRAPERLFHVSKQPWAALFYLAATQVAYCCHMTRLCSAYQRDPPGSGHSCNHCRRLAAENEELRERLSHAAQRAAKVNTGSQTHKGNPRSGRGHGVSLEARRQAETEKMPSGGETRPDLETAQVAILTARVTELEEQLSITSQSLTSAHRQHGKDMADLKAVCERGLAAMEESHLKVSEELQRRHLQEVDRLLEETDRLLEEETAATATAMEAMERAHRREMDKEVQRRCQVISVTGGAALMEHVHKQHSEELASSQRELEGLSYEFSQKCLENSRLLQALDAERKALSQRQQENQNLMALNQELSTQLTNKVSPSSPSKQEALPLGHDIGVYKMEMLLRVKECELQSVRQQLSSLHHKVQATQKVKVQRLAAQEVPGCQQSQ